MTKPDRRWVAMGLAVASGAFVMAFGWAVGSGFTVRLDAGRAEPTWSDTELALRDAAEQYAFSPSAAVVAHPGLKIDSLPGCWAPGEDATYNPAAVSLLEGTVFRLGGYELQQVLLLAPVHRRAWITDLGPGQYLVEVIRGPSGRVSGD